MEGKGGKDSAPSSGMNQETVRNLDQSGVQIDHLENIIVSLSQKIQQMNDMEREQEHGRQLILDHDAARLQLQEELEKSAVKIAERAASTRRQ